MQFLDALAAQRRPAVLVAQSNSIKIVCILGGGRPRAFGLVTSQNALQIVCNLRVRGTNLDAIGIE
jgi:hypothetical protein